MKQYQKFSDLVNIVLHIHTSLRQYWGQKSNQYCGFQRNLTIGPIATNHSQYLCNNIWYLEQITTPNEFKRHLKCTQSSSYFNNSLLINLIINFVKFIKQRSKMKRQRFQHRIGLQNRPNIGFVTCFRSFEKFAGVHRESNYRGSSFEFPARELC